MEVMYIGRKLKKMRFRIPFDLSAESSCFIQRRTQLADLLCQTSLIIWDEATMTSRVIYDAFSSTLQDIRGHLPVPVPSEASPLSADIAYCPPWEPCRFSPIR